MREIQKQLIFLTFNPAYISRNINYELFCLYDNSVVCSKTTVAIYSQVRNLQKLKNISLKAVNFFATKTKVTCLSECVFYHPHIPELPQFSRPCG